ncbi:hypothetical protein JRQ81_013233 [Phrynocephalus forsythii]|uniref:Uncharacterized protein n=1 Tax=Phrynocephalus forsythii TaxID=171643 RepID=A0A9Q0XZS3_9SAUR|nr:hypothetical protein JRQ81_013233 [Phrynocephalus forsythii]
MSLLQSALEFLAGPGSLGAASRDQNDFVGQVVEMGEMKLRIKRVIAEEIPVQKDMYYDLSHSVTTWKYALVYEEMLSSGFSTLNVTFVEVVLKPGISGSVSDQLKPKEDN